MSGICNKLSKIFTKRYEIFVFCVSVKTMFANMYTGSKSIIQYLKLLQSNSMF